MDYNHSARLTVRGREYLAKSAGKWVKRYREAGVESLENRSSRPAHSPRQTPAEPLERVERMRRERWTGLRIAQTTGLSRATVSRILVRLKLNKIRHLEPQPAVIRYERQAPGDMIHIHIKKLARIVKAGHRITGNPQDETRGAAWEFLYIAMYPNEKAVSSASFLAEAVAYFQRFGIRTQRVLTDNGPSFISNKFKEHLPESRHQARRTRFYRPQSNGNAERFIQTAIREWAYARRYENSAQRLE